MDQIIVSQVDIPPYQQVWIPLPDGTVLAGRLWLPEDLADGKVPVVLEWIPYRQSDLTAVGDSMLHGWFPQHGIASLRVDLRGSGNSDGLLTDEYTGQEQDDAVATIAWAAEQSWCTGAVGMIGISWSGFAALQVAARRPPALKAIITCCSTDDRYSDDVHFMGGCLLNDGLQWGTGLFGQIARPPDPAHVGPRWREMWQERIDGLEPPLVQWLSHLGRDAFWKHASVCENYDDITCAVYAVGGWTDGYSDPILRMMQNLSAPRKALIGPWTHIYPTWGTPGPKIGFLQECLRWWRHWLLGEDTGIMDEPMLRLWLGKDIKPHAHKPKIDGSWITLPAWPPVDAPATALHLHPGDRSLSAAPVEAGNPAIPLETPTHCGLYAGEWCPNDGGGDGPEYQADQRADDGLSLCFDSTVLDEAFEIVGKPILEMDIALQGEATNLAIRLCELAPSGVSARVTFGLHRIERPAGCAPGEKFRVSLPIKGVAYSFSAGSRIRIALSTSYYPMVWPEPVSGGLELWPASATFLLPGMPASARRDPPPFGPPEAAPPIPHQVTDPGSIVRMVTWEAITGKAELISRSRRKITHLGELSFGGSGEQVSSILPNDPSSAAIRMTRTQLMERPGWSVRLDTSSTFGWQDGALKMDTTFDAFYNGEPVASRTWEHLFPWTRSTD